MEDGDKVEYKILEDKKNVKVPDAKQHTKIHVSSNKLDEWTILKVAALMNVGISGTEVNYEKMNPKACLWYARLQLLRQSILILLISVNVWEEPSWCGIDGSSLWTCGHKNRDYNFFGFQGNSHDTVIAGVTVDSVCVISLLLFLWLKLKAYGMSLLRRTHIAYFSALCLLLCASVLKIIFGYCSIPSATLRSIVIVFGFPRLRGLVISGIQVIPGVADLLVLLGFTVVFFGILGVFIFRDRVILSSAEESNLYFSGFSCAFNSLFILTTSANNPDVMLPAYRDSRIFVIFFAVFVVLTIFFINNLILASVFDTYRAAMQERLLRFERIRKRNLHRAYVLLRDSTGRISRKNLYDSLTVFRKFCSVSYPEAPSEDEDAQDLMISFLQSRPRTHKSRISRPSSDGATNPLANLSPAGVSPQSVPSEKSDMSIGITRSEFLYLPMIFAVSFRHKKSDTEEDPEPHQRRCCPKMWVLLKLMFLSWKYELIISSLILVEFGTVLAELEKPGKPRTPYVISELFMASFLAIEVSVSVFALGWRRFWHSWRRRWQLLSAFAFLALDVSIVSAYNGNVFRYVILFRTLRPLWLLYRMPRFHRVFRTMWVLLEPFMAVLGLLAIIMAFFASIGVHSFGGLMYQDNPDIIQHAPNYAKGGYWPLHFNDFMSAYIVCFQLLVVNNWFVIMNGTVAAVGNDWAKLYFIVFYLVGVLIILNIVVTVMLSITKIGHPEEVVIQHARKKYSEVERKANKDVLPVATPKSIPGKREKRDIRELSDHKVSFTESIRGSWGKKDTAIPVPSNGNVHWVEAVRRKKINSITSVYNMFGLLNREENEEDKMDGTLSFSDNEEKLKLVQDISVKDAKHA